MANDAGKSTLMYAEAQASAQAVAEMLGENAQVLARIGQRLRNTPPAWVGTIARGSSDNACTYGRYLLETSVGVVCASLSPSLGSIYRSPSSQGGVCFAVSQSGASPDLLASVERVQAGGALVVGLINQPGSHLAALCDEVVALAAGPERSVAATKSYICSLAALARVVGEWTQDESLLRSTQRLPELLEQAWHQDWSGLTEALRDAAHLYVLGRGPGLGVAQEAALKYKETCGLHAEAFSSAEVVHGPMALIGSGFPVLSFAQGDASISTSLSTAEKLAARGAKVFMAGGTAPGTIELPTVTAHAAVDPILTIQSFYRSAANLSVARGHDPDNPPHLSKVTRTH